MTRYIKVLGILMHGVTVLLTLVYFKILLEQVGSTAYANYQFVTGFTWLIQFITISGLSPVLVKYGFSKKTNLAYLAYQYRIILVAFFVLFSAISFVALEIDYIAYICIALTNLFFTVVIQRYFVEKRFLILRALGLFLILMHIGFMSKLYQGITSWLTFEIMLFTIFLLIVPWKSFQFSLRRRVIKRGLSITMINLWANIAAYIDRMIIGLFFPNELVNYHLAVAPSFHAKNALKPIIDESIVSKTRLLSILVKFSPLFLLLFTVLLVRYYYNVDIYYIVLYTLPVGVSLYFITKRLELAMYYSKSKFYIRNIEIAKNASIIKSTLVTFCIILDIRLLGLLILLFEIGYFMAYRRIFKNV